MTFAIFARLMRASRCLVARGGLHMPILTKSRSKEVLFRSCLSPILALIRVKTPHPEMGAHPKAVVHECTASTSTVPPSFGTKFATWPQFYSLLDRD